MHYLQGQEFQEAVKLMYAAGKIAERALCLAAKCGTVIVKDGEVIGEGYNAPPLDDLVHRSCDPGKPDSCVHAEWRAIMDACRRNPEKLKGSTLYFTRVHEDGSIKKSGQPYCTVCSRLALDAGVKYFVLWQEEGMNAYKTDEYNRISYGG